jgi:hypothetical protein
MDYIINFELKSLIGVKVETLTVKNCNFVIFI